LSAASAVQIGMAQTCYKDPKREGCLSMKVDTDRIDDAVLALLWLGRHQEWRAWKSFDWDAMDRLYQKGFISDPVGKAKSIVFSDAGLRRSEELFREMFERGPTKRLGLTECAVQPMSRGATRRGASLARG
jgi:Domain of unknown function (DUF6429)